MLIKAYLTAYFAILAIAVVALWQGDVLGRLPLEWVVLVLVAAVVLGVLLALVYRNRPTNPA